MAYEEQLAARVRAIVDNEPGVSEQRMFGGLAFLVHGNMAVSASGRGGILVRVDPADSDDLVRDTAAYPMEMRGRSMDGWLRVDANAVADDGALQRWIDRGIGYARSLPPKKRP